MNFLKSDCRNFLRDLPVLISEANLNRLYQLLSTSRPINWAHQFSRSIPNPKSTNNFAMPIHFMPSSEQGRIANQSLNVENACADVFVTSL